MVAFATPEEAPVRKDVIAIAAALSAISLTQAWAALSERQAWNKATHILMGDPYGNTPVEVAKVIKDAQLLSDGKTKACGVLKKAVWQFHVVVPSPVTSPESPIDGYLVIDANNGKLLCANLPMLD
jgi:hypothetical protein